VATWLWIVLILVLRAIPAYRYRGVKMSSDVLRGALLPLFALLLVGCAGGVEHPSDPRAGGGTLLYAAEVGAGPSDLFLVGANGTGKRDLTHSGQFEEFDPDWSPDGDRIVFAKRSTNGLSTNGLSWLFGDLVTMRLDGSGETRLTSTPDMSESSPSWSPDGKTIAFEASNDVGDNIYTMPATGGSRTRLTPFGTASSPTWSPDGRRIAFQAFAQSRLDTSSIFVMDADGGNRRQLTASHWDTSPAWSPDGDVIAFQRRPPPHRDSRRRNPDTFPNSRILLVSPEGGPPSVVRDLAAGGETYPAWSPDGERLAFVASRGLPYRGEAEIGLYVVYAEKGAAFLVTRIEWGDGTPVWRPRG
jgi:TolB protein